MFSVLLTDYVGGSLRKPLTVLLAAVAMVLLIACANIAGLQMARASARQRDFAVRVALGASRSNLLRQAFLESLILTLAGLALGVAVAFTAVPLLVHGLPSMLGGHLDVSLRGPVFLFVIGIAVVCSLLCGVVPAWQRTQPGWFNDRSACNFLVNFCFTSSVDHSAPWPWLRSLYRKQGLRGFVAGVKDIVLAALGAQDLMFHPEPAFVAAPDDITAIARNCGLQHEWHARNPFAPERWDFLFRKAATE